MNNKLIIFVLAIFSNSIYAQKNVDSPYSNYGLGEFRSQTTEENRLMGGISVYSDSVHLNLKNPAAYGDLKYTTFIAGINLNRTSFNTESERAKSKNSTLDYIALGFPISKKIGVGLGMTPYTSVGYKIVSSASGIEGRIMNHFEGKGGVNRGFLSAGYEIFKGLNVGASLYANFGNTEITTLNLREKTQLATREFNKSTFKGLNYNIGISYRLALTDKLTLTSAVSYIPEAKISSKNMRTISTLEYALQTDSFTPRDIKNIDLSKENLNQTELILPYEQSIGMGIGEDKKWFAGVNYTYIGMKNFENKFIEQTNASYQNGYRASLGGFFIPQYNSFTNYWKRITYRFGLRYEDSGIILKNQSVKEFGISFGMSLPLRGFSNATVGAEYGQRGINTKNLIQENYYGIRIGFTLNDKWFQRTKY